MASSATKICSLKFNQDQGCFTAGMECGFRIYNVEPLVPKFRHKYENVGSIGQVEMLHRTNVFAIVGGGTRPKFADSAVLIMDDLKPEDKLLLEITFDQPVLAVKLREDKLVAVLRNRIHVFSLPTARGKDWHLHMEKLFSLHTRDNPLGLCALSSVLDNQLMIFPAMKSGSVQLLDLATAERGKSFAPTTIQAHQNSLACMVLNQQATLIATASTKGTLIRVFDVATKRQVLELRRGADSAMVYCINFSHDDEFLCTSSDKGTVHIFAIKDTVHNRRSSFKDTRLCKYVEGQWGLASFTVPAECACLCAFGRPEQPDNSDTAIDRNRHTVIAICVDGTFHKHSFTSEGGCRREAYDIFTDLGDDFDFTV